jgi:hypothetical protein
MMFMSDIEVEESLDYIEDPFEGQYFFVHLISKGFCPKQEDKVWTSLGGSFSLEKALKEFNKVKRVAHIPIQASIVRYIKVIGTNVNIDQGGRMEETIGVNVKRDSLSGIVDVGRCPYQLSQGTKFVKESLDNAMLTLLFIPISLKKIVAMKKSICRD